MAYIEEHKGVEKETEGMAIEAGAESSEDIKLVKAIRKQFQKAKKHRSKFDHKWLDYYRLFRGRQWKEERPAGRHAAVFNKIFQTIQSQVPLLTDSRPKIEFLPQEPSDFQFAKILTEVADNDWERDNWLYEFCEMLFDSHIYGTGLAELYYDEEADYGAGKQVFSSVNPFYCFPDPLATDVNCPKSRYFIYAEPMDVDVLKKKYPDKKDKIKSDVSEFIRQTEKEHGLRFQYRSPVNTQLIMEGAEVDSDDERDQALLITRWCKDEELIELEDGTKRKKYPNGRRTVIVNNIVLEDGPNPYEHGKFPYMRLQNYILPREFWGISEIEPLEGPQLTYNKIYSFILDVLTMTGNPVWIVDQNAGIDTDNMLNSPGMILEPTPNSRVQRVEGTQLQPYVMQLLDKVYQEIQDLSGANEVSRGVRPAGVTAAKAIEALQDTAQTRLRQKSRNNDGVLNEMGQMWQSNALQFYSAPRVYRVTNDEGAQSFFKMHVETVQDPEGNEKKSLRYRELANTPDGQVIMGDENVIEAAGQLDTKVSTGSSLPFAKTEKAQLAFQLFDRQIIDAEEVLKTVDWPNKEAIIERMTAKAQEAMAAQQGQMAQEQGQMPAEGQESLQQAQAM